MDYIKQHLLEKGLGQQHGTHWIYWIPIEVFKELPIRRWRFNRPLDMDRVDEIRASIIKHKRVDGLVYLAYIKGELINYESGHRWEALRGVTEVEDILVDILWDGDEDDVVNEFRRLNKAVSVPDLYIKEDDTGIVDEVRAAVEAFCVKYAKLKVPSARPQRPNFNRDTFTDEFFRVMKESKWSVAKMVKKLDEQNARMATIDRTGLSPKVVEKCEKSGLWLFAWSSKLTLD
jgi:hypothetical protein